MKISAEKETLMSLDGKRHYEVSRHGRMYIIIDLDISINRHVCQLPDLLAISESH